MTETGEPDAVLTIDVGTSRVRASVIGLADGSVLDESAGASLVRDGEIAIDDLWRELTTVVRGLGGELGTVRAIAVAAQLGVAVLDSAGRPVRNAFTWSDARAVTEADELRAELDSELRALIGRPIAPELTLARCRWLARHEPGALAEENRVVSIKDALLHRLTGRLVTDEAHASYSGLFDVAHRRWEPRLVAAARLRPEQLPRPLPATAAAGGLVPEAAAALGLVPGLPCAVGGPDGTVGALGAGGFRSGVTVDIAGTTDVIVHTTERPRFDPDGRSIVNAHLVPGLWTVGGPTGLTGGAIEWMARVLGYDSVEAARANLEWTPLTGDAPVFLPSLGGTRFPSWRPDLAGEMLELAPHHRGAHLFAAAQLGVACAIEEGLQVLRELGIELHAVTVVGGAARRAETLALRSDCWGLEIVELANPEATTTGLAMLAGVAAGRFADLAQAWRALGEVKGHITPATGPGGEIAAARERWARARRRHDLENVAR